MIGTRLEDGGGSNGSTGASKKTVVSEDQVKCVGVSGLGEIIYRHGCLINKWPGQDGKTPTLRHIY